MPQRSLFGSLALTLCAAATLAGCAGEDPYVTTDYRYHQRGDVRVCLDEDRSTIADAKVLAEVVCKDYERTAKLNYVQRYQCNWTAPTLAYFVCVARPGETPPPFSEHLAPMRHDQSLGPQ